MRSRKNIILAGAILAILFCAPHISIAQSAPCANQTTSPNGFVPLACYSGSPQFNAAFTSTGGLPDYISNVFKIALSVGAILAVLRIAYGGYMYMGSADMWGNKQQAREAIGDAIIGLLLLFGIYLILYQLNPNLLNLNVLNDITPATGSSGASNTTTSAPASSVSVAQEFNGTGGPFNGTTCQSGAIVDGVCK